jgi:hypothetical protein
MTAILMGSMLVPGTDLGSSARITSRPHLGYLYHDIFPIQMCSAASAHFEGEISIAFGKQVPSVNVTQVRDRIWKLSSQYCPGTRT